MPSTSTHLASIAAKESRDELTDYTVYKRLSKVGADTRLKGIFSTLADTELRHFKFWTRYSRNENVEPHASKVRFVLLLRRVFGATFAIKYLEKGEAAAIKKYEALAGAIPRRDLKQFRAMIVDEKVHERTFIEQVRGAHAKYISFIVLGLADALVEVTAIYAGSLGVYNSTTLTGLAGIIAGIAASISMASAAFAQAKNGFEGSPTTAAAYTGVSYFAGTAILAVPYFLTANMLTAIASSITLCVLVIASVSWYNSVISNSDFRKDFAEFAGVMFAATIILFIIGTVIRHALGISV
jgi:VIT1/CCC1 family predicted Fe2+/Mn2+ transporter